MKVDEHEIRVSEFMKNEGFRKTSKADGYYTEEDFERQRRKEYNSLYNQYVFQPQEVVDILKLISEVLPRIEKPKEKIVIEKYLMGYSISEIVNLTEYKSKSGVHSVIKKHLDLIKEVYEDEEAIMEMFQSKHYIYREPEKKNPVEKNISQGRILLETLFGFETYIYPFDIYGESYKITLKHPKYGMHKYTKDAFLKFVSQITNKIKE